MRGTTDRITRLLRKHNIKTVFKSQTDKILDTPKNINKLVNNEIYPVETAENHTQKVLIDEAKEHIRNQQKRLAFSTLTPSRTQNRL